MVVQYFWVLSIKEDPSDWNGTLIKYKNMVRVAVIGSLVFFFTGTMIVAFDWWVFINPPGNHLGLTEGLNHFRTKYGGSLILLFMTFFAGVIRLFVERSADEDSKIVKNLKETVTSFTKNRILRGQTTKNEIVTSSNGGGGDAWFAWFCFSLASTAVVGAYSHITANKVAVPPEAIRSAGNTELLVTALVFVATISLGYFCWIYMIVFHKLTGTHHFSGRTARIFLGGVFRGELPRQAIMIGPRKGGKSSFMEGELVSQTSTSVSMRYQAIGANDGMGTLLDAAIIDLPGENMGDHIILSATFRADTLVFVIDALWLTPTSVSDGFNYELENWSALFASRSATDEARDYMKGFYFATKRDVLLSPPENIFKVRSFVFYLNDMGSPGEVDQIVGAIDSQALDRLASKVGERFGVKEDDCCWFVGNSLAANESIHLLTMDTAKRKLKRDGRIQARQGSNDE
jgi:hypothetical protein